jgi:hypothetical protein
VFTHSLGEGNNSETLPQHIIALSWITSVTPLVRFLLIYIFLYSILSFHGNSIQWSLSQVTSNVNVVLMPEVSETLPLSIIMTLHDECCVYIFCVCVFIYAYTDKAFVHPKTDYPRNSRSTEFMLLVIGSSLWCIEAEHWIHFTDITVLVRTTRYM